MTDDATSLAALGVDESALESVLAAELDERVVDTELLHEALNLSIGVSTAERDHAYVVRRPHKLRDTDLVADLESEFRVLERLADTTVDAPEPVLYCDDESIVGAPFFVMTYLEGESTSVGDPLPERFQTESARRTVGQELVDALADVHSVDPGPFAGVCERVPLREQLDRDRERLDTATNVTGRDLPALHAAGAWLRENVPEESDTALVHGDFKPGNVFLGGTEAPRVTGVVDWETAMVGDPLTELGYFLLYWRDPGDPTPSVDDLDGEYASEDELGGIRDTAEHGLCPFTSDPGSPSRGELVARYEEQTGRVFEHSRFYRAHAAFSLATVWEDIHRHQIESAGTAGEWPIVEYMGRVADRIADGDFPL
jgi:aminoglycoside phosphotransferase (APT) family kinase protein